MFAKVVIIISSWWNLMIFTLSFVLFWIFFKFYSVSAIIKITRFNKNKNKGNYKYYREKKKKNVR